MNEEMSMMELHSFLVELENYDSLIYECQYRIRKEEAKLRRYPHMNKGTFNRIHSSILDNTEEMRWYIEQKQELYARV